jgi:phosphopentomutase
MHKRVILIVMDSVGVGQMPDAHRYGDSGSNTLANIYKQNQGLVLPTLCSLGLGHLVSSVCANTVSAGCFGKMATRSVGKDTTSGHWEIAGLPTDNPFPTYPEGFPRDLMVRFEARIGIETLGNYPVSGTRILAELGREHMQHGQPIVYTSADSVFQIAAHEDIVPLNTLYDFCRTARELLVGENAVARVIARPFTGVPGRFIRNNAARKDFSMAPPQETLLDILKQKGLISIGVGKIGDIFGHRGLTEEIHTDNNSDGIDKTLWAMQKTRKKAGLIFTNLVDFDSVYGHRRDVAGYAKALEAFDREIPCILSALAREDILMITADHGCDPTHTGHTDHTREYVPLLIYGKSIRRSVDLGIRATFADCGQTIADLFQCRPLQSGTSFKKDICHA